MTALNIFIELTRLDNICLCRKYVCAKITTVRSQINVITENVCKLGVSQYAIIFHKPQ